MAQLLGHQFHKLSFMGQKLKDLDLVNLTVDLW